MEISVLDKMARADSPLHLWDGRVKTVIFLGGIILSTAFQHWYFIAIVWMSSILLFSKLHLPWRNLWVRLYIPFGVAWLVFVSLLFTNGSHTLMVLNIGKLAFPVYIEGMQLGFLMLLRIMTAVTLGSLLSFSTPMIEILETLRLCKVPSIIIDLAAMMYRYVFILEETARSMRRAQLSRMGDQMSWLRQARDVGKVAGHVLIKSLDRSTRIYKAMLSRGYSETSTGAEFFTNSIPSADWKNGLLLASLLILLLSLDILT
ncbi:nickel and/or cobalt ABC transporter, permease subunit Q [Candidatus Desulfosporosinus infrequens]|uniref:Nickel and/or cobalt ABC transporter, permease subunit Q n=1 Tax=Candidatus Desulfosporosinus infrequens TaxID=2043169 RepID=A0A2U3LP94_9FIRM|nr:nickel and/or cobalt ABC transporter, permease subunit Q [Candidatus Desulfosporosinus infrequens]